MTLNANIRERRCRFQGDLFPAPETEVGPHSRFSKARRGSPASDDIPATDFRMRQLDRSILRG